MSAEQQPSDPRVFFASERTLLAWLRTGIAVIGLGFLVARFGYFLAIVKGTLGSGTHHLSTGIGVVLVLLGVMLILGSAWQQRRFVRSLSPSEVPHSYSTSLSVVFSVLLAVSGIVLAAYLLTVSDPTRLPSSGASGSPPADSSASARP